MGVNLLAGDHLREPRNSSPRNLVWAEELQRNRDVVSKQVLIRDMLIFQAKLLVDSLKDIVVAQLALVAVFFDLLSPTRRGRFFYGLLAVTEKFDRWLNLYTPPVDGEANDEGLLGASRKGSNGLITKLQQMLREAGVDMPEAVVGKP